jgi:reactive chlorine resistance protein C
MPSLTPYSADDTARLPGASALSRRVVAAGRGIALAGVVIPLVMIGILKFTQYEIDALKPLIGATPWLAWLYAVLGDAGTTYLLGVVELITAALFIASPWSARAGLAAGALGSLAFAATTSTLLAFPIWEPSLGGFPYLNFVGTFLIKDVALLGVSLVVLGEGLARTGIVAR